MLRSFRTYTLAGQRQAIDKVSVTLDQWADGPAAQGDVDGTGKTDEVFMHGNLNPSKAHYNEGDAIPYRLILDNMTPGVRYGAVIEWDTIDQGGYAIDYLTGYNYSFEGTSHEGEPDADPLQGVRGMSSTNETTAAIQPDPMLLTGFGSQYGATDGLGSTQPSGAQFVSVFGSVSDASVSETTYSDDHSKASVTVWFTYTGSAANNADAVVLAWGGHIAATNAWDDDEADAIDTAMDISGSPYHMRVLSLVENDKVVSVGNQDRSMQSGVVSPPPVPSDHTIGADEDNLAVGNLDTAPGDDNTSNLSGTLAVTGANDINFASLAGVAVLDTVGAAVTSHGDALTYYWDAASATLYASTDASTLAQAQATAAFQIVLSGTAHLDYAFTLLQPLDHPSGAGTADDNTENPNVLIDITYTAVDGTSVNGTIHLTVDDDMPVRAADAVAVAAGVREDGMSTSLGDSGDLSEGNRALTGTLADDETSSVIAGSLADLVSIGADGPGIIGMSTDTSGLAHLYSKGEAVAYAVTDEDTDGVNDTLTATAGSGATERIVFTLHVGTDGSWEFDLDDQIDHVSGDGENTAMITAADGSTHVDSIDFSSIVQATDYDGDTVTPLLAGDFAVAVQDDIPVRAEDPAAVDGSVSEDGLDTVYGDAGDLSDGNRGTTGLLTDDETSSAVAGSLADLVAVGADEPPAFGVGSDFSGLPDLYSKGELLAYEASDTNADGIDDTLVGKAGSGETARVVFTLHIGTDGSWEFDLDDQFDHADDDGANTALITSADGSTSVDAIDFSSIVTAVDNDGDSVAPLAAGDFTMTIHDDVPVPGEEPVPIEASVSEDGLSTSLGDAGDLSEGNRSETGTLADDETGSAASASLATLIGVGADEPPTFGVGSDFSGLPDLYSKGEAVAYAASDTNADGIDDTLTATAGSGETERTVFTLHIGTDGSWEFDLDDQLDHAVDDGENTALITAANGSTSVDAIDFSSIVLAVDNDGDRVGALGAGDFTVSVKDDIPARAADPAAVEASVSEDGLSTSLGDTGDLSEGNRGLSGTLGDDETGSTIAGSLADLVAVGADEAPKFGVSNEFSGMPDLYSKGDLLAYAASDTDADGIDDTLTATAGSGETERTVFTLHVGADGSWEFDLDDQLDHVANDGENSALITAADGSTSVDAIDFSSIVAVFDNDVDAVTPLVAGDFTVTVHDDIPLRAADPAPIEASVSEDGLSTSLGDAGDLSEGNRAPGGTIDDDETSSAIAGSLADLVAVGADEDPAFGVAGDLTGLPDLYSKGELLAYAASDTNADGIDDTLTATAGSGETERTVFTLHIGTDGSWEFDLDDQLDHVDDDGENSALITAADGSTSVDAIDFSSIVQAVDNDGDAVAPLVAGDFTVAVHDDIPVRVADATPIEGSVSEDGLSTSLGDAGDLSEANRGASGTLTDDETGSAVAGSLADLVAVGADEPPGFSMASDTSGLPALYSKGEAVAYAVSDSDADGLDDLLTATAGSGETERTVFTLHIATDGSWTFDLDDQLDHVTDDGENGALITAADGSTSVTSIDFSSIVQATDNDGDRVAPLVAGDFTVAVQDDIPVRIADATPIEASVYEDAMSAAGGDSSEGTGGSGEPDGDEATSTGFGMLDTLLAVGADETGVFGLGGDVSGLPDLYSKGDLVSYAVTDEDADGVLDTLTASAGSGAGRTVFTLVVGTDGSWTFDLDDQLDHVAGEDNGDLITSADGSTHVASIDFSSIVQITDNDGDSVSLNAGDFTVAVEDDMPMRLADATPIAASVHEDGMSTSLGDAGDLSEGNRSLTGTLGDDETGSTLAGSLADMFVVGADETPTLGIDSDTTGLPTLYSKGEALSYAVGGADANGVYHTLTATAGSGADERTVFTLQVDADGSWTFDLDDQLDHADGDGENTALITAADGSTSVTSIDFSSVVQVWDFDGDSSTPLVAADFTIAVQDDVPVAFTPDGVTMTDDGVDVDTGNLNAAAAVGADEPATIVFVDNYTADDLLRDTGGNVLQSNKLDISLSGWGTGTLTGSTTEGTVFTATLDAATDQYTIDFDRPIDNGSGIDFLGAAPVKSGNPTFNIINNVGDTTLDLLFSGGTLTDENPYTHTVNVSTQGAGTGNQTMNTGETLRIDFVSNATLTGSPNGSDFSLGTTGTHEEVEGFKFLVTQDNPGGTTATVLVTSWEANDDKNFANDTQTQVSKVLVNGEVLFDNGTVTDLTVNGHTVHAIAVGMGVVITGLNEGLTGDGAGGDDPVITVYDGTSFNRIEISNYAGQTVNSTVLGGANFDIAPAGLDSTSYGDTLNFELAVQMTDYDGDTSPVEVIGVQLDPMVA